MLILASKSPRRRELLALYTENFEIITKETDEPPYSGGEVSGYVMELASKKAEAVAESHPGDTVIGADTVVAFDGVVLGKPRDLDHAREMLSAMSEKRQEVYTGVCIISKGKKICFYEKTHVCFRRLSACEIDEYVATGDCLDKAGAYGIQGGAGEFVSRVVGDYFNVIGLPMKKTAEELSRILTKNSEW